MASSSPRKASRMPNDSVPSAPAPNARTWSATSSSISACHRTSSRRARSCAACSAWTGRCGWPAARTRVEEDVLSPRIGWLRARYAQALLVLVPRHPPRFDEVADSLRAQGVNFVTRTSGAPYRRRHRGLPGRHARRVAGVLRRRRRGVRRRQPGSHRRPQPARTCCARTAGAGGAEQLQFGRHRADCWSKAARCASCDDAPELAAAIGELLADPAARTGMGANGRKAIEANRGAVGRLMAFLEPLLP